LLTKSGSLFQLQIKRARLEGAAAMTSEEINRLEHRTDSLRGLFVARNKAIESQTAKITELTANVNGLQAKQKEWADKNEVLTTQINALTQNCRHHSHS
jgi:chromosome segregation ATPase